MPSGHATPAERERANEILRPYVPRLVVDWLRDDPSALHREVEGSLAFVDISGFTALSERLAQRGKIGAEVLRDTLDDVFVALLDTAYDDGAGLLKWGGDALLLLFDGPGHEERACHAAWEMQRTLDRVGRLRAGGATIVLRMSIGITTGTFQLVLAGSVHRELLIAGPAVTETVAMEAIADAGEIAISPTLARRLDRACLGTPKGRARLLAAPPQVAASRAPHVGGVSTVDLPACIPIATRAHVMLERSEPEHRTITAAFIDLMATDALLERAGIDGLARALDERICTIQEAALRYEVPFYESDVGTSSVKALLTAGAPSTTGHDEERMLRALREIIEMPGEIELRIGVNTGRVFTGDFGPSYRRSYRVFGDAVNTAARVMSRACAGQILATETVLERSRSQFETTPIEPFAAKGKSEPIRAAIVGPVLGQRAAALREAPVIGRERELEALLRVVEEARGSRGWIVDLSGRPGLGKTRLVKDLVERAGDVFVFHTRCEEYESSTPYFPLRAPFRAVLGLAPDDDADVVAERLRLAAERVDPSLVPWAPLFGVLLGVEIPQTLETRALEARFIPERLAETLTRFLFTGLAGTTTMLVVEDAQHMDESSRDLLRRLAQAGADRKQVLLVTHDGTGSLFQPGGQDDLQALSLSLVPLSLASSIALVNAATDDDPLPSHAVEEIARRAGGSPLFLFELLDVVRETGSVEALPDSVEAVVAAEIDRLSPADRTVLRYAAVLGTSVDRALLAAAVEGDVELDAAVWERLGELVEQGAGGELRFRNALIRDAAYEGLPYRRRRVLHGRVGETLEARAGASGEDAGALALHFFEAQRHDKAWTYCRLAADRAGRIYANVEAARFLERALAASRRLRSLPRGDVAAAWEQLGDVRERIGAFVEGIDAYRHARRLRAGDATQQALLYLKQARAHDRLGEYSLSLRWTRRGLNLLEGADAGDAVAARAQLETFYAIGKQNQGRGREAVDWCRRGIADAEAAGDDRVLAHALFVLDWALVTLGRIDEATNSARALAIYEELDDLPGQSVVVNGMGAFAYWQGRWDDATALYERSREIRERLGDPVTAADGTYNIAEILVDQGRFDEAETMLTDVLRTWRAADARGRIADATRLLGRIASRTGRPEEGSRLLEDARAVYQELGAQGELAETEARIAGSLVRGGLGAEGLVRADAARSLAAEIHVPLIERIRGYALLQLGDPVGARDAFATSLASARSQNADFEAAVTLDALVRLDAAERRPPEPAIAAERDEILDRLGVVHVPEFPTAPQLERQPVG